MANLMATLIAICMAILMATLMATLMAIVMAIWIAILMAILMAILNGYLMRILMEILLMDFGWPYESSGSLLFLFGLGVYITNTVIFIQKFNFFNISFNATTSMTPFML